MKSKLNKFSFGVGDRFAHQAKAQLQAILRAKESGCNITPVWNKSFSKKSNDSSSSTGT